MNFTERRKQVFDKMDQDSALLLFSGIELHVSADEYLPFEANRNFFYLTGLRRDHMILMMKKTAKEEKSILFIEEADLNQERWFGRKVTVSEAQEITGIDDVRFLDSFEGMVNRLMAREDIGTLYFDCYRYQVEDLPDYNLVQAEAFAKKFPGRPIKNIAPFIAELRMQKDVPSTRHRQISSTKSSTREQMEPHSRQLREAAQTERCCTTIPTAMYARMRHCC